MTSESLAKINEDVEISEFKPVKQTCVRWSHVSETPDKCLSLWKMSRSYWMEGSTSSLWAGRGSGVCGQSGHFFSWVVQDYNQFSTVTCTCRRVQRTPPFLLVAFRGHSSSHCFRFSARFYGRDECRGRPRRPPRPEAKARGPPVSLQPVLNVAEACLLKRLRCNLVNAACELAIGRPSPIVIHWCTARAPFELFGYWLRIKNGKRKV